MVDLKGLDEKGFVDALFDDKEARIQIAQCARNIPQRPEGEEIEPADAIAEFARAIGTGLDQQKVRDLAQQRLDGMGTFKRMKFALSILSAGRKVQKGR